MGTTRARIPETLALMREAGFVAAKTEWRQPYHGKTSGPACSGCGRAVGSEKFGRKHDMFGLADIHALGRVDGAVYVQVCSASGLGTHVAQAMAATEKGAGKNERVPTFWHVIDIGRFWIVTWEKGTDKRPCKCDFRGCSRCKQSGWLFSRTTWRHKVWELERDALDPDVIVQRERSINQQVFGPDQTHLEGHCAAPTRKVRVERNRV